MTWFVMVGQSLQLCCVMICAGFMVHKDLLSGVLMTTLFGYYFVTGVDNHSGAMSFRTTAVETLTSSGPTRMSDVLATARNRCESHAISSKLICPSIANR